MHIDLCHIRNCSTQRGVFLLEEYGKLGFSCFGAVRMSLRNCEINGHKGMKIVVEVVFFLFVCFFFYLKWLSGSCWLEGCM